MPAAIYHFACGHRDHREDRQHLAPLQAESGEAIDPCPEQNHEGDREQRHADEQNAIACVERGTAPWRSSRTRRSTRSSTRAVAVAPPADRRCRANRGTRLEAGRRRAEGSGRAARSRTARGSPGEVAPHQRQDDCHGQGAGGQNDRSPAPSPQLLECRLVQAARRRAAGRRPRTRARSARRESRRTRPPRAP